MGGDGAHRVLDRKKWNISGPKPLPVKVSGGRAVNDVRWEVSWCHAVGDSFSFCTQPIKDSSSKLLKILIFRCRDFRGYRPQPWVILSEETSSFTPQAKTQNTCIWNQLLGEVGRALPWIAPGHTIRVAFQNYHLWGTYSGHSTILSTVLQEVEEQDQSPAEQRQIPRPQLSGVVFNSQLLCHLCLPSREQCIPGQSRENLLRFPPNQVLDLFIYIFTLDLFKKSL